jgi:hypothetical protein
VAASVFELAVHKVFARYEERARMWGVDKGYKQAVADVRDNRAAALVAASVPCGLDVPSRLLFADLVS